MEFDPKILELAARDDSGISVKALRNSLGGKVKVAKLGGPNSQIAGQPGSAPEVRNYDFTKPGDVYEAYKAGAIDLVTYRRALESIAQAAEAQAAFGGEDGDAGDEVLDGEDEDEDDSDEDGGDEPAPRPSRPTKHARAARVVGRVSLVDDNRPPTFRREVK